MNKEYNPFTVPSDNIAIICSKSLYHCENEEIERNARDLFGHTNTLLDRIFNIIQNNTDPHHMRVFNTSIDEEMRDFVMIAEEYGMESPYKVWMQRADLKHMNLNESERDDIQSYVLSSVAAYMIDAGTSEASEYKEIWSRYRNYMHDSMRECSDIVFEVIDSRIPLTFEQEQRLKSVEQDKIVTYIVDLYTHTILDVSFEDVSTIAKRIEKGC